MQHNNAPNQKALSYRLGTQPTFLRQMLARLSTQEFADAQGHVRRPLSALTTRDLDDPAIALLDAWAGVLDVLTFYQERIANEGYLGTAGERRSVIELSNAIGYDIRPGLAASVSLAFTVDDTGTTTMPVTLDAGLKVQSVPGQDELPQTFETVEAIAARPEWNAPPIFQPQVRVSPTVESVVGSLRLDGFGSGLQPNSQLFAIAGTNWYLPIVKSVEANSIGGYTTVALRETLQAGESGVLTEAAPGPQIFVMQQQTAPFGHNAPEWSAVPPEQKQVLGGIYALDNTRWTSRQQGLPYLSVTALTSIRRANIDTLFVATPGNGIYRSTDGGISWAAININLTNLVIHSLGVDGAGSLLAGSTAGTIFRSLDQGESWTQLSTGSLVEIQPGTAAETNIPSVVNNGLPLTTIYALAEDRGILYAGTDQGLYQSNNEGVSWSEVRDGSQSLKGVRALLTVGETLLIGTRIGLYRRQKPPASSTYGVEQFAHDSLSGKAIQALAIDPEGTILVGTEQGIRTAAGNDAIANLSISWLLLRDTSTRDVRALTVTSDSTRFAATPLAGFVHPDWPNITIQGAATTFDLEGRYPQLQVGDWIILRYGEQSVPRQIAQVASLLRSDFGQTGVRVTRLTLTESLTPLDGASLREVELLIQSEALPLFAEIRPADVRLKGNRVELAQTIPALNSGRRAIVCGIGRPANSQNPDTMVSEVAIVSGVNTVRENGVERSEIVLRQPLANEYVRETITLWANVALATHGETVADAVLGSGDGNQRNQHFRLQKPPLTYVSAPTDSGAASTLAIHVNGILWSEVQSLHTQDANSQSYLVRHDSNNHASIIFGDGQQGARLPTGVNNVVASYRSGLGLAGEVSAESLTSPLVRPLGLTAVTNPVAASGGADPESVEEIRTNAPLNLLTMARIVSLSDFEDFAQTFNGIGQAQAALLWSGDAHLVQITLADSNGDPIPRASALCTNLLAALDQRRNRLQQVQLDPFIPLFFNVDATITIDPAYQQEAVEASVRAALTQTFSFQHRRFGQAVTSSEVISAIQKIPGVIAVDLNALDFMTSQNAELRAQLPSWRSRWVNGRAEAAQLLLINPNSADIQFTWRDTT